MTNRLKTKVRGLYLQYSQVAEIVEGMWTYPLDGIVGEKTETGRYVARWVV